MRYRIVWKAEREDRSDPETLLLETRASSRQDDVPRARHRLFPISGDHRLSGAQRGFDWRLGMAAGARPADLARDCGIELRLPADLVSASPQHPAQPLDVEIEAARRHLEAHPLRSSSGSQPPRGPVRRAPHDIAD